MKKVFSFFTLCIVLCVASCYDDTAIRERLEALETTTIASINDQISGIKKSITDLETTDKELDAAIEALIKEDGELDNRMNALNDSITKLQQTDKSIKARLQELANALPSLYEQDSALEAEIASIVKAISELDASDGAMQSEIASLQQSLQELQEQDKVIKEKIEALEKSIAELRSEGEALQAQIVSINETLKKLEEKDATFAEDVDSLRAKDKALDARITELKTYIESELSSNKDWANATFSTLEQYEATCNEIAAIKVLISEQEESLMEALAEAIDKSESSMKAWVNEQLTGYWTIAQTQAKLDTIKSNTDKEVAAMKKDIQAAKEELTTAYKTEIQKAIEESYGKLSAQIAEINSTLNAKITAIEVRLTAIEEKLNNLTREFTINFNDNEIGIMPGGTATVGYTITGATSKTIVKAIGQNGWSAKVTPNGTSKGTITVTAPSPMTNDEIIVLVYDGEYRTIMSTLNFVKGFATPSRGVIELDAEAGTISVPLTTNIDYNVSIPLEAQNWLSFVNSTRSVVTENINFAYAEYSGYADNVRKATVSITDKSGTMLSSISFIQYGRTPVKPASLQLTKCSIDSNKLIVKPTIRNLSSEPYCRDIVAFLLENLYDDGYLYATEMLVQPGDIEPNEKKEFTFDFHFAKSNNACAIYIGYYKNYNDTSYVQLGGYQHFVSGEVIVE